MVETTAANGEAGVYGALFLKDDELQQSGEASVLLGDPGPDWALRGFGDYWGDDKSDLLFENVVTGQYVGWESDDAKVIGTGQYGAPGPAFSVVGPPPAAAPELPAMLFFQNTDDAIVAWDVADGVTSAAVKFGNPGPGWKMLGVGNFQGDDEPDILFRASNGNYALWTTNAAETTGGRGDRQSRGHMGVQGDRRLRRQRRRRAAVRGRQRRLRHMESRGKHDRRRRDDRRSGFGLDLRGGGRLQRRRDHRHPVPKERYLRDLGNRRQQVIGGGTVGTPGSAWTFEGAGDFNGDGKADLLFRSNAGVYATWDLSGTTIVGGGTHRRSRARTGRTRESPTCSAITNRRSCSTIRPQTEYETWNMTDTTVASGSSLGTAGSAWTVKAFV